MKNRNVKIIYNEIYDILDEKFKSTEHLLKPYLFETLVYFIDKKILFEVNLRICEFMKTNNKKDLNIMRVLNKNDNVCCFIIFLIKRWVDKNKNLEVKNVK